MDLDIRRAYGHVGDQCVSTVASRIVSASSGGHNHSTTTAKTVESPHQSTLVYTKCTSRFVLYHYPLNGNKIDVNRIARSIRDR